MDRSGKLVRLAFGRALHELGTLTRGVLSFRSPMWKRWYAKSTPATVTWRSGPRKAVLSFAAALSGAAHVSVPGWPAAGRQNSQCVCVGEARLSFLVLVLAPCISLSCVSKTLFAFGVLGVVDIISQLPWRISGTASSLGCSVSLALHSTGQRGYIEE